MTPSPTIDPKALQLRAATLADTTKLEQLVHLAYRAGKATVAWKNEDHLVRGPRITAPEIEALTRSKTAKILLATAGDQTEPIACILVEKHDAEAHIGLLAVRPDCQNLGLGKRLIEAAEQQAREGFACTDAKMCVLSGREELLGWYKRLGYAEIGEKSPFPGAEAGLTATQENAHFIEIGKKLVG
jgi:ribosomal protein S18 acetylase RimI-like enzyme